MELLFRPGTALDLTQTIENGMTTYVGDAVPRISKFKTLASYVFTRDNANVMKAVHKIRFGETYVNQVGPEQLQGAHTGFIMLGVGAEGSRHGLELYTQLKTCYVDWNDKPSLSYLFPHGA